MTEELDFVAEDFGAEWIPPLALLLASDLSDGVTGRIFAVERGRIQEYCYQTTSGVERRDRPWTASEIADCWTAIEARGPTE